MAGDAREGVPPLRSLPGALVFVLAIRSVKADAPLPEEEGAAMLGGLRFSAPVPLRAAWRAARRELRERGARL